LNDTVVAGNRPWIRDHQRRGFPLDTQRRAHRPEAQRKRWMPLLCWSMLLACAAAR